MPLIKVSQPIVDDEYLINSNRWILQYRILESVASEREEEYLHVSHSLQKTYLEGRVQAFGNGIVRNENSLCRTSTMDSRQLYTNCVSKYCTRTSTHSDTRIYRVVVVVRTVFFASCSVLFGRAAAWRGEFYTIIQVEYYPVFPGRNPFKSDKSIK